mgnify:CR=1 FL=1
MAKPRIFLGSSGAQAKFLRALERGLGDVADVEPWMTTFNPGTTTLGRLLELTREVDFAAFVSARAAWPTNSAAPAAGSARQASPRDNVVFEAGLFGGVLGMRRTFILHASGAKLPTDLLGLTCVRYDGAATAAEVKTICQKLRNAIESEGRASRVEGLWWQYSLTQRTEKEPSALSLLKIARGRGGALEIDGRAWQEDGTLSCRYRSEAIREKEDGSGVFYYWKGERPMHADSPQLEGTGEIRLESVDRGSGYFTTRGEAVDTRTSGIYRRAEPADIGILDGQDDLRRAELIAELMARWKSIRSG